MDDVQEGRVDEGLAPEQESKVEAAAREAREERQRLLDYYSRVEDAFLDGCCDT